MQCPECIANCQLILDLARRGRSLSQKVDDLLPQSSQILSFADVPSGSLLRQRAEEAVPRAVEAFERLDFSNALDAVLSISGRANQYLEETAPWTLLKKVYAIVH